MSPTLSSKQIHLMRHEFEYLGHLAPRNCGSWWLSNGSLFRLGVAVCRRWCRIRDGPGRLCCRFVLVFAHHPICRRMVVSSAHLPGRAMHCTKSTHLSSSHRQAPVDRTSINTLSTFIFDSQCYLNHASRCCCPSSKGPLTDS
jgi:hypothetical protein